jgi:integrase
LGLPLGSVDGSGSKRRPWQRATVLNHLARAVAACGKRAPKDRQLPEAKRADLHFHDLRHTTASLLVAARIPLFDVSKILGHKRIEITMRYAHSLPNRGARRSMGSPPRSDCDASRRRIVRAQG